MKIGVTFPHFDFGADRAAIRSYIEAARDLGYDYFLAYDHVLGADVTNRPGWTGYTSDDAFHEVFTLFAFASAIAPEMEMVPGVIILPQRQTALVAKQAAQIDIFTGGKFRLGVGVGWNPVEYEALGQDFRTRGRREEEQIALLRRLWTEPILSFRGEFDQITDAGLNPLPIQQPIPIWIGGTADVAIERAARLGDGWFPQGTAEANADRLDTFHRAIADSGRDPAAIGIEARVDTARVGEDAWEAVVTGWREAGASYISINTMNLGLDPAGHIGAIERFKQVADRIA
jgi:probable F420-dependent oxidoreductase